MGSLLELSRHPSPHIEGVLIHIILFEFPQTFSLFIRKSNSVNYS